MQLSSAQAVHIKKKKKVSMFVRQWEFLRAEEADSLLKCLCSPSVFHQWQKLFVPWSLSSSTRVYHIYPFIAPNFCIAGSTLQFWQVHPKKRLEHKCQRLEHKSQHKTVLDGKKILWEVCVCTCQVSSLTDNEFFVATSCFWHGIKGSFNPENG